MHQDSGQDTQQTPFYYISGATDAAFPGTAQQPASRAAGAGTPQYASQRQQQQAGQQQALAAQPIVRWASGQQQQFRVSPVVQAVGVQAAQAIQHLHIVAAQHNQAAAFLTTTGQLGQAAGWGGQPLASSSNTGFAVHGPTTLGGLQPVPIPRAAVSQRSSAQHSNEIIASLVQTLSTQSAAGLADLLSHALGQLDGRQCAAFLRECGHRGGTLVTRAWEVFNWLRSIPPGSPYSHLRGLLDVFTYTAMISMCAASKDVYTAFELSREMEQRGILLNVHTYSALMNVAVKAGRSQLALDTFQRMQQAGCSPNLVTYNTLIDVYGKLGLWADAIQVLSVMRDRGVEPVVRTYNTLMIACTISNRWQEALQVYQRMREAGLKPNTTTYNALISAYSKAGQLDKVMAVFAEMVEAGCERSVITYSTLIAACERCGQWETALQLFARMPADGCQPNTITYNSLITACAQGMQWQLALQLFDQMVAEGHTPDVVSYTALISACGKGCQWRRALQAFSRMQSQGCQPDHIIYETMVEALWATGVRVPQLRAVQLYRSGMQQGLMRHIDPPLRSSLSPSASPSGVPVPGSADSAEISISSGNPVMLSLGLQVLLLEHMERVLVQGAGALPGALVVRVGGKGRARDPTQHSNLMAALRGWLRVNRCPLQLTSADGHGGLLRLVSTRGQLAEWLQGPAAEAALSRLMVPIPAGGASGSGSGGAWLQRSASQQDAALQQQEARYASMETWCVQAFHIIHQYEAVHRLSVAAMSPAYLDARPDLLNNLACVGEELQVPSEQVYDALLLTDRAMAGGLKQLPADQFFTALLAALLIVSKQASPGPPMLASGSGAASSRFLATAGRSASGTRLHGSASAAGAGPSSPLTGEQVASIAGVPMAQLQGMQATLRTTLAQGTAAVSAVHSLRMYHFCLGYSTGAIPTPGKVAVSPVVPDSPSSVSTGQPSLVPRSSGGPSTTASGMEGGIKGGATLTEPAGFGTMRPGQPRFGDFPEQGDGLGPLPDFSSLSLAERPSATAAGAAATAATGAASVAEAPRSNPLATALLLPRETETKLSAQPRLGPTATSPAALQQQPSLLAAQSQLMSSPIGSPVGITAISVPSPATSSGGAIAALGLSADDMELCSYQLMHLALGSRELLKLRPSVLAAAALHGARLLHGHLPLWPTALVQLTGGMDVTHPELATAITLVARLGV